MAGVLGCSEPKYVPRPLPALVAPAQATELREILPASLGFEVGDRLVWEVRLRGMAIGRAELNVEGGAIRSRFATGALASAFAHVEHDLVTVLEGARPASATERIDLDGKVRQFTTDFAGTRSHSVHTALGGVRAWAVKDAAPGFMLVVVGDKLVRLELQAPTELGGSLRVDGKIVGLDDPVSLTIWMDAARSITRVEVRSDGEQITATPSF